MVRQCRRENGIPSSASAARFSIGHGTAPNSPAGYVPASGTQAMSQRREPETSLFVLIARRMELERSGSSSQRPLGLSSRVAFCYLRSVLPDG
jgi:hypothetical protein